MDYIYYTILGLAPSLVWLLFYLRKDNHPEPKRLVLKIFFWGAAMGPVAILFQIAGRWFCQPTFEWSYFFASFGQSDFRYFLNVVLFAPIVEEYLKYAVVRKQILKNPAFDEPLDAMLYLIISALGFAAVENLLNIFLAPDLTLKLALTQSIIRFLSATFLHTLASGLFGFFIALSLLNLKKRRLFWWGGFLLASGFHSLYNYFAWLIDLNNIFALAIAFLLILMGALVSWQFYNLKKQLSVCKIR
jgi:RsiW-degrading membrane proteinase PrsW (M82 family)